MELHSWSSRFGAPLFHVWNSTSFPQYSTRGMWSSTFGISHVNFHVWSFIHGGQCTSGILVNSFKSCTTVKAHAQEELQKWKFTCGIILCSIECVAFLSFSTLVLEDHEGQLPQDSGKQLCTHS